MIYYLLTALVILLQIGDMMTTMYALKQGGCEANPVMAWVFSKVGVLVGMVSKGVIIAALAIACLLFSPVGLIVMAAIYVAVVGWNCYQITLCKVRRDE